MGNPSANGAALTRTFRIDAHVHLWDPGRGDDILIVTKQPGLAGAATVPLLDDMLATSGCDAAIVVQSAPSIAHSDWLRQASRNSSRIVGVVGWLDPFAAEAGAEALRLAEDPRICGIRLMLNRMPSPGRLLEPAPLKVLDRLAGASLTIEVLAPPHLLSLVADLARALPEAKFVLDHCGTPPVHAHGDRAWREMIRQVGSCGNVATKLSGIVEAYDLAPAQADIMPTFEQVLDIFGCDRLMAASNFPVVDLAGGSARWWHMLAEMLALANLAGPELARIYGGAALESYPRIARQ